jgi:hypothetical protein
MMQILELIKTKKIGSFEELKKNLSANLSREQWMNIGSQLIRKSAIDQFKVNVKKGVINSWDDVHAFYVSEGNRYPQDKLQHAYNSLLEILQITSRQFTATLFTKLLNETFKTKEWLCKGIYQSRAKDYSNPFRKMVYESVEEMNKVIGTLEDNSFIQSQMKATDEMKKEIRSLSRKWGLK